MAPSISFRLPPAWFFKFPPDQAPLTLPPPVDARTFASPFAIPTDIYNGALDYKVPITIASIYAVTVILWNRVNRERGHKPYEFSKTAAFKAFVIVHNVFLAVFSAFTFVGMIRALAHTWPGREHHLLGKFWPGLRTANGVAGAADALCKLHGPRGFGQFAYYDPADDLWKVKDSLVRLSSLGSPDSSDVGRIWNEGLAFWGWWFYLSKFYEVFDTFIILAKGKRSSTLQTYHHTGAMMCMWAGIRFMSPPIWMFCFLNSGIHTMMYIYYTLSALSIKVPTRIKRSLTTMQIMQFLIGITFAGMHLFVTYRIPITTAEVVSKAAASIPSAISSGVSSAAAVATSAGFAGWLKQAALRAAGEEGLAENVFGRPEQVDNTLNRLPIGNRYHGSGAHQGERRISGWETVPCIDTSGQAFAIWLNLLYLAPLTGLFVRFFIRSYTRRGSAQRHPTHKRRISKSIQDAAHGTNRELDSLGKTAEDNVGDLAKHVNGNGKLTNGKSHSEVGNETPRSRKVSQTINKQWERFEKGAEEKLEDATKGAKNTLKKKASDGHDKLRRMFEQGGVSNRSESPENDRDRHQTISNSSSSAIEEQAEGVKEYADEAVEKLEDYAETAVKKAKDAVGGADTARQDEERQPPAESKVDEQQQQQQQQQSTPTKSNMDESWADVAKETFQHKEEEGQQQQEQQKQEPQQEAPQKEEEQSSSNKLEPTRSMSPSKRQSHIPRPKNASSSRSRSPDKKAAAPAESAPAAADEDAKNDKSNGSGKKKSGSKPRKLKSNNGTAANNSSSSNTATSSLPTPPPDGKEDGATAKDAEESKDTAPSTSHIEKDAASSQQQQSDDDKKNTEAAAEDEETTNGDEQKQDSAKTSARGAATGSENVEEDTAGKESERLRFRHVVSEEGEAEGGEAEVKEGVSFAEAAKDDA